MEAVERKLSKLCACEYYRIKINLIIFDNNEFIVFLNNITLNYTINALYESYLLVFHLFSNSVC